MSNQYYGLKWQEAISDLQDLFQLEQLPLDQNETANFPKGYKRQDGEWFLFFATLYIKYIDCYKKLEDCYDQMLHPQKRQLLREMLDNVMVQMCQTKQKLVRVNATSEWSIRSDFVNLDELIMDLKLMPNCIEVPIPRFCSEDEQQKLNERNQLVNQLLIDFQDTDMPEIEQYEEPVLIEDFKTAIETIQRIERGRLGIEKVYQARIDRKIKLQKEEQKKKLLDQESQGNEEAAAQVLIKYWRGTVDRMKVQSMREQEMKFLGITLDKNQDNEDEEEDELDFIYKKRQLETQPKDLKERVLQQRQKMKMVQDEHQNEYESDLNNLKELVRDNEGADIKEKMLEERRKWIFEQIEKAEFQDVPQNLEEFNNRNNVLDEKAQEALKQKMEEESKKKGKKDDKKGKKGGKPSELDEFNAEYKPQGISEEVLQLQKIIEKYGDEWAKKDENANFEQKHETKLAMERVKPEVETQVQTLVDEIIEIELDNIRAAFGKKKKKQKKKKGPKKGKGGKKKFPGDAFNKGKDPRDILAFLIEKGVVKKLPPALMSDIKGEANVLGSLQERTQEYMADPSMLQLKQCIAEQIGIPLGSRFAKDKLERQFYYLFYGPQGSGKSLAVRALATECNALLIDISPTNLEGKFTDNKALQGCINSAFRVAQNFQPAIIYCQDAEMIFAGKKKKGGPPVNTFFTKMKKPLSEFQKKKFLLPEQEKIEGDKRVKFQVPDRVAFIACSNKPYEGNVKDMRNFFEKKFYFPYPNYATRKLLFRHFVEQKGVYIPENFSLSTISHITDGFSAGSFKIAIDKVLTKRRLLRIKEEPIQISEFISPISSTHSTYGQELKSFQVFTDDVCQFKERRERRKNPDEDTKKGGKKGKK